MGKRVNNKQSAVGSQKLRTARLSHSARAQAEGSPKSSNSARHGSTEPFGPSSGRGLAEVSLLVTPRPRSAKRGGRYLRERCVPIFAIFVFLIASILFVPAVEAATFGKTTVGGTVWELSELNDYKRTCKFTLSEAGDVTSVTAYVRRAGGGPTIYGKGVIYSDSAGEPGALLGTTLESSFGELEEWVTFTFATPVSLAAGDYHIGIITYAGESKNGRWNYDTGTAGQTSENTDTYSDGASDPFGTHTDYAYELSIYATYTPVTTTTVGDGVDPSDTSLCPGDGITDMDSFTLQTSSGTDDVTDVTVSLASGTYAGLSNIAITSDDGATTYGSVANPASDTVTITTTSLTATTTETQYKVRVTPKSHADMPAPPGSTYSVSGTVTAITSTNTKSYEEVDSATVTIDNASPADATWGTITPGDTQIELNWTNPSDADFNEVVILRNTATISDAPVEGTTYTAGNTIGTSTVVYVGALQTFTDTGLTNGTDYYYKIFARDTCINYATGIETGPHTPEAVAPGITVTPTSGLITTEAGGTDTFTVVLDTEPTADVSIDLSSSDTTEGTVSPTSLTFTSANWDTPQTVTVTGVDDTEIDGDILYTIITAPATSADPNYDGIDPDDVTVTNIDDDAVGAPTLTYPASPYDDGMDPDTGNTTMDFTFKVIYTDAENDAPATGYPKVYIGDNDGFFSYTMTEEDPGDTDYTDGKTYFFTTGLGAAEDLRFYFEAQAATGDLSVVTLPSDAPTSYSTGPSVYLLSDHNVVGVPKDLGTGLAYSSVLGDDSGSLYCVIWDSTGLDTVDGFSGSWSYCTSGNIETGKGYFIWTTDSNFWRLDEPDGVGNVTASYFDIALDPDGGWNMISNPYNVNIQLQNVIVVKDGIEYTFSEAVANGWIDNSIYEYEGPVTGYTFRAFNDTPPATLEPWVGYFIYVKDTTTSTTLRLYAP